MTSTETPNVEVSYYKKFNYSTYNFLLNYLFKGLAI